VEAGGIKKLQVKDINGLALLPESAVGVNPMLLTSFMATHTYLGNIQIIYLTTSGQKPY
jgi:hypothetical protein